VELRLSEAFEAAGALGRGGEIPLELALTVYNINRGHNGEMVERCEKLRGYSEFIGKVRELAGESGDREAAMEGAVRWCIGDGILRDFFEEHGTEVVNMQMAEWKLEDALVVEREEGREEGWEEGHEEGREEGWKERGERDREETIRNLVDFGMKAEQISRALKLPLDTIERYLK
jgi:hypothetical protein